MKKPPIQISKFYANPGVCMSNIEVDYLFVTVIFCFSVFSDPIFSCTILLQPEEGSNQIQKCNEINRF